MKHEGAALGNSDTSFVEVWVPAGGQLNLWGEGSADARSDHGSWWIGHGANVKVFDATTEAQLNETSVGVGGGAPGPGRHDVGEVSTPLYVNSGAVSKRVVVSIYTTRGEMGGSNLVWSAIFPVVGGNGDPPPVCKHGIFDDTETFGENPALCYPCAIQQLAADPVDTRTGNLHMPVGGIGVTGRGPGLGFELAYNSLGAATAGVAGYGWSTVLDMRLVTDGSDRVVVQEGGSTVRFTPDGSGGWEAPARFTATLVNSAGGTFTFTRNHFDSFKFNSTTGALVALGDQFGNETTISYTAGKASFMEDEAGRKLTFGWSGSRLASVADPASRDIELAYDGAGNLVTYTDVADGDTVFTYDGGHRLWTMRKPRHTNTADVIEVAYDHLGRVMWQEDELDRRTSFEFFTPTPGSTTVTFPSGRQRVDVYDGDPNTVEDDGIHSATIQSPGTAFEQVTTLVRDTDTLALVSMTNPADEETVFTIDGRGNRLSATDPSGRVTRWTYNAFDQATSVSVGETKAPLPVSTAAVVTTELDYDGYGRMVEATDAVGKPSQAVTGFTYDTGHLEDLKQVVDPRNKTWLFDYAAGTGDLVASSDPLGNKTTMAYNSIGWVVSSVAPKGNKTGGIPADYTTSFTGNARGQVTEATEPGGNKVRYDYDGNGNQVTSESGLSPSVTTGDVTSYGFDDADQLVSVDPPGAGAKAYAYTADGQRESFVNESNAEWTYEFDGLGRPEVVTDPVGAVTRYGYDAASRLASVQQPGAGATCAGPVKVACVEYSYDGFGRLDGVNYSDPATADLSGFTYDSVGRRTAVTAGGDTEEWSWDHRGRLTSHVDVNARTTGYGWDAASNLTSILYPGKATPLTRAFDNAGRLSSVTDWSNRVTSFGYDENSNWKSTTFPAASLNSDVRTFDTADRLTGVTWKRGATTLGSLAYGPRDEKGMVTSVTATGVGGTGDSWAYDARDRVATTTTEDFGFDAATNLIDNDGVLQVFDPAQRLCWTSPTAATGACATPADDATSFGYDARGNRTSKTLPSGTTASYGFDAENRMTSAEIPTVYDPGSRQFQLLAAGATRVADGADGTGSCDGSPCGTLVADAQVDVDVAGQGSIPATGVTAVTGTVTVTDPNGDGWLTINPNGDAAAAVIPLSDGGQATATFTAALDTNGNIQVGADVDATVAIDITGYWTPPPAWVPALNYWPVTPEIAANTGTGAGTCDGTTCTTLTTGAHDVKVTGVGDVPTTGVAAVTLWVLASNTTTGSLRLAPNGDASAGEIMWDSGFPIAAGSFTVPVNPDGTIDLEVANATNITMSVTGYWKTPTATDTGLGLHILDGPERLVDTTTGTGTCNGVSCDQITSTAPVTIKVTGEAGVPENAVAVMVTANVIDPVSTGLVGLGSGAFVFEAGDNVQSSFITALNEDGTITATSWATIDLTIDVVGYFTAPTRSYTYEYDTAGLRSAKELDGEGVAGQGFRNEYTWDMASGLALLLVEHGASSSSYLVYGPGGTPLYQVTRTGDVMYFHQDHLGSTRLTTHANGTVRGAMNYDAHGQITANTNPWISEQPLPGYNSQYHDIETGFVYLRARYLDPATGQFITLDPIVAITEEPYGYTGGNPANRTDPAGKDWGPIGWVAEKVSEACIDTGDDDSCETVTEQHPEASQHAVDYASGALDINPITAVLNATGASDTGQYAGECGWRTAGRWSMATAMVAMAAHAGWAALNSGHGIGFREFARVARHQAHRAMPPIKGGAERVARWLEAHPDFRRHWHFTWRGVRSGGK